MSDQQTWRKENDKWINNDGEYVHFLLFMFLDVLRFCSVLSKFAIIIHFSDILRHYKYFALKFAAAALM